jgi:hypothetical protein
VTGQSGRVPWRAGLSRGVLPPPVWGPGMPFSRPGYTPRFFVMASVSLSFPRAFTWGSRFAARGVGSVFGRFSGGVCGRRGRYAHLDPSPGFSSSVSPPGKKGDRAKRTAGKGTWLILPVVYASPKD